MPFSLRHIVPTVLLFCRTTHLSRAYRTWYVQPVDLIYYYSVGTPHISWPLLFCVQVRPVLLTYCCSAGTPHPSSTVSWAWRHHGAPSSSASRGNRWRQWRPAAAPQSRTGWTGAAPRLKVTQQHPIKILMLQEWWQLFIITCCLFCSYLTDTLLMVLLIIVNVNDKQYYTDRMLSPTARWIFQHFNHRSWCG